MRQNLHVYNARSAMTLETRCESAAGKRVTCTVNLEIAVARPGRAAEEPATRFDWADKERIKVGLEDELPDLFAVLAGWLTAAEFLYHGPRRTKGYRAFALDHRVVIESFSEERGRRSVALQPAARARVAAALFRVLQRDYGGLASEALMTLLQSIYTSGDPSGTPRALSERPIGADSTSAPSGDDANDPYDW